MIGLLKHSIQTLLILCVVLPLMFLYWASTASFINLNTVYFDIRNWEEVARALLLFSSLSLSAILIAYKKGVFSV